MLTIYSRDKFCHNEKGISQYLVFLLLHALKAVGKTNSCADNSQGLIDAEERHGFEGDNFTYLKSPMWWLGLISCMR
jgi:hypothetical protein